MSEVAMRAWIGLAVISLSLLLSTRGWSADLRVMSGGAPQEVLAALTPEFENQTGHKVIFTFAVITALQQRLAKGEKTDLVLMPVPVIDQLVQTGTLRAENRATLGVLGISVIVRQGAAKPDISTPDRLRQALLKARSVAGTLGSTISRAHSNSIFGMKSTTFLTRLFICHATILFPLVLSQTSKHFKRILAVSIYNPLCVLRVLCDFVVDLLHNRSPQKTQRTQRTHREI